MTALFLLISLIFAFIFVGPSTLLIFELDPIDRDHDYRDLDSIPASTSPIEFIFGFLIVFVIVFSILTFIKTGNQFAYKRILNNENRKKIAHQIFLYPGIHYNELLRATELQPGTLQWHLNKLIQNRIVRKDKVENFVVYFPMNMRKKAIFHILYFQKVSELKEILH